MSQCKDFDKHNLAQIKKKTVARMSVLIEKSRRAILNPRNGKQYIIESIKIQIEHNLKCLLLIKIIYSVYCITASIYVYSSGNFFAVKIT